MLERHSGKNLSRWVRGHPTEQFGRVWLTHRTQQLRRRLLHQVQQACGGVQISVCNLGDAPGGGAGIHLVQDRGASVRRDPYEYLGRPRRLHRRK
jgi:hypothetical protein